MAHKNIGYARAYAKAYRLKNKERLAAYYREYRAKNRQHINNLSKKYWHKNIESNRLRKKLYMASYRNIAWSSREDYNKHMREYYAMNKSKILGLIRASKIANPSKWKERSRIGRIRYRSGGRINTKTYADVFRKNLEEYGRYTCVVCNNAIVNERPSIEHLTPVSRGGSHELVNLNLSHLICNIRKHTKTMEELASA